MVTATNAHTTPTTHQPASSADTAHAAPATNPFEFPSMDEATQQMRDLNERTIATSKNAALLALDSFEKALKVVGDLEQKAAAATKVDWVSAAATSHAKFMTDVSGPYTTAVRDLLK